MENWSSKVRGRIACAYYCFQNVPVFLVKFQNKWEKEITIESMLMKQNKGVCLFYTSITTDQIAEASIVYALRA